MRIARLQLMLFLGIPLIHSISVENSSERRAVTHKELIVVDTDGGIDDSLALMLALDAQDKAQVLAVTCVFGDTDVDNACQNVFRVFALSDSNGIPVYRGSPGSLTTGKYVPALTDVLGYDGLGNRSEEFPTGGQKVSAIPAAIALSQLARRHPGLISLLAIGPLTNIALVHRMDPHFTSNLKEIICLGGNYNGIVIDGAEFNFKSDPLAANIVLSEAVCPVTIVPFETTVTNGIPRVQYKELVHINSRKGYFLRRVSEVDSENEFRRGFSDYLDFDVLAVAALLYPESVTSQVERPACVEYEGMFTQGWTVFPSESNSKTTQRNKIKIITDFNSSFVNQLLFQMIQR